MRWDLVAGATAFQALFFVGFWNHWRWSVVKPGEVEVAGDVVEHRSRERSPKRGVPRIRFTDPERATHEFWSRHAILQSVRQVRVAYPSGSPELARHVFPRRSLAKDVAIAIGVWGTVWAMLLSPLYT